MIRIGGVSSGGKHLRPAAGVLAAILHPPKPYVGVLPGLGRDEISEQVRDRPQSAV
jgi:hypothetical protein